MVKILNLVGVSPKTLLALSTVSGHWNRLCREDELWRRLFGMQWANLPTYSLRGSGWFQLYKRRHTTRLALQPSDVHPIENCLAPQCPSFLERLSGRQEIYCQTCSEKISLCSKLNDIEDIVKSGRKGVLYQNPIDLEISRWEKARFNVLVMGNSRSGKSTFCRKLHSVSRKSGNAWPTPQNRNSRIPDRLSEDSQIEISSEEVSEQVIVVLPERSNYQYPRSFNLVETHGDPEKISQWIEKYNSQMNNFNFDSITLDADTRIPTRPAKSDKNIHLVVYCVDVTDGPSITKVERNYRFLRAFYSQCPVLILVCKSDLRKDTGRFDSIYSWYNSTQIPISTISNFAKKEKILMHLFSKYDSDSQISSLMDAMAHFIEYGRPRNFGCNII